MAGLLVESTKDALDRHLDLVGDLYSVSIHPLQPPYPTSSSASAMTSARGHKPLIWWAVDGMMATPRHVSECSTPDTWPSGRADRAQLRVRDFTVDNAARIVTTSLYWSDVGLDFLRDIGKHFPVNRMLAREVVRTRLEEGISYTEFSYVLLQSLDYLELYRSHGCTLQFGGSDQWGNITAGVELIRRVEGARVHAMATPLLTKAAWSKSAEGEGNICWTRR